MSPKKKNDYSLISDYEQSLTARFQRLFGLLKTEQMIIDASPQECLKWMEQLVDHPPEGIHEVVIETHTLKLPYQFGAQIIQSARKLGIGFVIGDIDATPYNSNKSILTLRFYQDENRIIALIYMVGFPSIMALMSIISLTVSHFYAGTLCVTTCYIGMLLGSGLLFSKIWYKGLLVFKTPLLKLDSMTQEAISAAVTNPENDK